MKKDLDKGYVEETNAEANEFFKNPNFVHFIGMLHPRRAGVMLFLTRLEYEKYKPGTNANNNFYLRIWRWKDITWSVISVPKKDIKIAKKIAKECEIRMVDGVPAIIGNGKIDHFPINPINVKSLENVASSEVYSGKNEDIIKEEDIQIELLQKKFDAGK
jgi:hypothetical protein